MQHDDLRTQWLKRAENALKGQSFDAEAVQGRIDGPRAFRGEHGPWKVFARIDHTDRSQAKAQAEDDLRHGVDGLIMTSAEVTAVLDELPLHQFALRNEAGDLGAEAIRMAVSRQPVDPARLSIDFAISDVALVKPLLAQGFTGPFMKADGRMAHAQGMDDAQELGVALAEAIAELRKLEHLEAAVLSRAVSMTLSASQQMFDTLAKFRAARILWARVLEASGLPDAPLALHGETSRVMYSDTDAHTNILRAVTAVFGAGLGGADSICALPFSFNQGLPNGLCPARGAQCAIATAA